MGNQESRWSEREVGLILKRALELQQEEQKHAPGALQRTDGASLAELEEMAQEVGVEPALVRRAAAELEARPRAVEISRWTGGPRRLIFQRVLRGEASPAAVEGLLGIIQEALGEHGQPGMVGRTFTWTSINQAGRHARRVRQITLSVVARDGVTTIRLEEQLRSAAGAVFGPIVGGLGGSSSGVAIGIGVGALHSPVAAALIWLLTVGSAYAGARTMFRRTVSRRTEELQGVFVRIAEHLQAALDAATLPAAPTVKGALPSGGEE